MRPAPASQRHRVVRCLGRTRTRPPSKAARAAARAADAMAPPDCDGGRLRRFCELGAEHLHRWRAPKQPRAHALKLRSAQQEPLRLAQHVHLRAPCPDVACTSRVSARMSRVTICRKQCSGLAESSASASICASSASREREGLLPKIPARTRSRPAARPAAHRLGVSRAACPSSPATAPALRTLARFGARKRGKRPEAARR